MKIKDHLIFRMLLRDIKTRNKHFEFPNKRMEMKMNQATSNTEYDLQDFPIQIEKPHRIGNSVEDHIFCYLDIARV